MAVPAHDERDWEFAKKYEIPLKQSIAYEYIFDGEYTPKIEVETLKRKCIDVILENRNGEIFLIDEYNSDNDSHVIHFL
jgi:leucyl-tRNA synthetase